MKLDPVKVAWIVAQKERGSRNSTIVGSMKVSVRRVQRLYSEYRATGTVPELKRPGRKRVEDSREEKDLIVEAYTKHRAGAVVLGRVIGVIYGRRVPHNRIHRVLKSMGMARDEPRKQDRKK